MTDPQTTNPIPLIDLISIETDLADVEIALSRLEAGTYWTCEVTGQPLSEELLASRPTTRRAPHP
ncbi:MAG: hypothetical protein EXQ63_08835 [Ilumatobacteraceae bacterium]|nr:hypothetical protein [Ilumatobacteraceae bacterium]